MYLDVSVVEQRSTKPTVRSADEEYAVTNSEKKDEKCEFRRAVLLTLLLVSCVASWALFFVHANKLVKRFRKRYQKQLKKAAKKKNNNDLKVPLLEPEGTMKP